MWSSIVPVEKKNTLMFNDMLFNLLKIGTSLQILSYFKSSVSLSLLIKLLLSDDEE